jgi:iron(III) transport system substrate-binding protein
LELFSVKELVNMKKTVKLDVVGVMGTFFFLVSLVQGAEMKSGWQIEWEKTLEAAKKEGQLVIYGGSDYDLLFAEFQKRYPEIKVVSVIVTGREVAQRMMTERRAGKYLVDLYLDGASTAYSVLYKGKVLDPIKPLLILPEILDQSRWWMNGKYNYSDDEGRYIFSYNGELQPYYAYNTKLVNASEMKSYWDFLNPKWKGKMAALDPTIGGPVATPFRFLYYHPEIGPKFLRRLLGEMELTASRDVRQIGDWLATGRFALSIFTTPNRTGLIVAKKQGLPVDWFGPNGFREGICLSNANGNVGLINKAPHPNAARLAINWLLSREGQMAYQRIVNPGISNSLRIDIPKDTVMPEFQRVDGGNYVVTERPEWMDVTPVLKIVNEVWKK